MGLFDMCCPKKPKKSLDYVIKWIEDADKTFSNINTSIAEINTAILALQDDIKDLEDWKSIIESDISALVTEAIEDYDWSNLPVEALQAKADKTIPVAANSIALLDVNGNLKDSEKKISDFVGKVSGATSGNFAGLDSDGNVIDSGTKASDFAPNNYEPSSIGDRSDDSSYVECHTYGQDEPAVVIGLDGFTAGGKEVTINLDNIDNLNRALEKPDTTPIYGSDKLITSSAVAEGLNRKANSSHTQGIETIVGLDAIIASLTERIRALEEQPITESIQLTGAYPGYNTLLNEDSEDILYSAQSMERKVLWHIDTLYNFAEIGSAVTLSYTVPNVPSDIALTFNTVVVDKKSGPSRLVLRDSIPDVQYVNYTDIALTITK